MRGIIVFCNVMTNSTLTFTTLLNNHHWDNDQLDQVHLACRTQFGDHGWMAALGCTDQYWAILDRSGLYEIELDYTDNSAKFASFRPQNLPQQGLSIPRPSRLPLGFALGQSLGPRDAKFLLRQISWSSEDTSLSCTGLYWLVLGYTGQKWAVRDRTELYW